MSAGNTAVRSVTGVNSVNSCTGVHTGAVGVTSVTPGAGGTGQAVPCDKAAGQGWQLQGVQGVQRA